jgi:hypothetical protein
VAAVWVTLFVDKISSAVPNKIKTAKVIKRYPSARPFDFLFFMSPSSR